jgi:predicted RNA binding protein YcfA (HicA-like mRNA interferase family)
VPGFWDQVAVHEARGVSRPVAIGAARLILERRDPSHFAWDDLLHPRNRRGEFSLADVERSKHPTSRFPSMTAKQVHRMLRKAGFRLVHQRGSHAVFEPPGGGRRVVVPMHGGAMPRGTLRSVLTAAGAAL